jgi:hypothetical protein
MLIGKRIDIHQRWDLGNDQIEETNVYMYLGVYFCPLKQYRLQRGDIL